MGNLVEVGTIKEIHERLIAEGVRVSCYALRRWVKDGTIHAVYTGNKALISYASVHAMLKR